LFLPSTPIEIHVDFTRVNSSVEDMEAWNASGEGFSFVISHESRSGPGFRGQTGFMASWRPIHQNSSATRVGGSPFKTLAEAESACKAMASLLTKAGQGGGRQPHVNFDTPAVLRKWSSLGNERRIERSPYLLLDGTLDECLQQIMAKPASARHLYEIHVVPDVPLLSAVLPDALVAELARLRNIQIVDPLLANSTFTGCVSAFLIS
jgi:hypothetical protein